MLSEMRILESVSHPYLIRTYELLHDDHYYYIVTEIAKDGDLCNYYIDRSKEGHEPLSEKQVKYVAK